MPFFQTSTGRALLLSIAIAAIGGGAFTFMHGLNATLVLSAALFLPLTINVYFLPQAAEKYPHEVVMSLLCLPLAMWVYAFSIAFYGPSTPLLGYASVAVGLVALAATFRSSPAAAAQS